MIDTYLQNKNNIEEMTFLWGVLWFFTAGETSVERRMYFIIYMKLCVCVYVNGRKYCNDCFITDNDCLFLVSSEKRNRMCFFLNWYFFCFIVNSGRSLHQIDLYPLPLYLVVSKCTFLHLFHMCECTSLKNIPEFYEILVYLIFFPFDIFFSIMTDKSLLIPCTFLGVIAPLESMHR